jgi:8-amino-7-oxononanoate synthase
MPLAEPLQQVDRTFVLHRGRKLIYFGGCDYFRLSSHPDVLRAVTEGVEKFGLNVAASRMTTGNHQLFGRLENELAKFFNVEGAALLSNGYATNLAFAQSFRDDFTHAFIDERSHGSPQDAAALLSARTTAFRHRDPDDLRRLMKKLRPSARALLITDGLFGHDGSLAPLDDYLKILPRDAMMLVDDAHGGGTIGRSGKGTPEVCGVRDPRIVQTISLSKAFGVYGGAVLGTRRVIDTLQAQSRIFKGNTPPPPPLVHATRTSLKILNTDRALRVRLQANTKRIKNALRSAGVPTIDNESPLVGLTPRSALHADRFCRKLLKAGIYPPLVRYGDKSAAGQFRFAISSEHTAGQLEALASVLQKFNQ